MVFVYVLGWRKEVQLPDLFSFTHISKVEI